MLGIQLPESRRQHDLDFCTDGLNLPQVLAQPVKSFAIGSFDAQLEAFLMQDCRKLRHFLLERCRTQKPEHFTKQLQVYRAHRMDFRPTQIKLDLLLRNAGAHVLDHGRIFALKTLELHHLFRQITSANVDDAASLGAQI